ncbi:MAG TPA: RcnB family protein [Caulobacterales bacterium]|nr:RcnB family protein [Caulobacterales bacterium]
MKRFAIAALAVASFVGPLAAAPAFADPPGRHDNRGNDRHDNNRWDGRNNNGYYTGNQWHYGPPPANVQNRRDFRPGYQAWRRGDRLPSYYRTHYVVVDYHREHLRAPPRGYHYVRDDRGNYLLVGIATGIIASILLSH